MTHKLNIVSDVIAEIVEDDGSSLYRIYRDKDGSIEFDFDNPCDQDYIIFPAATVPLLMEIMRMFSEDEKDLIDQITPDNINIDRDWEKLT